MSCTHQVDPSDKERDDSEILWTCCESCDPELRQLNDRQIAQGLAKGALENRFSHEAIAHGIGKLKYPNDEKAASEYSFDWTNVLPEVENRMERILSELKNGEPSRPLGCRIGDLFNEIGTAVRERLEIPHDPFSAEFTCQFAFYEHKLDSSGMNEGEKPELVLVEHHSLLPGALLSWKYVKVPVVFFHGDEQTVLRKLLSSAIHIWSVQGYRRRFVMGIAFYEGDFGLICFNPSGIIHSESFCVSNAMNLARLVLGLLFINSEDLGYDPSVLCDEDHSTLANQKKYSRKVVCGLTSPFSISATTCVIAERSGELYTIKDVWLDSEENDDGPFEVQILRRISDVENVPRLVDHERVKTRHGAEDSTNPFWVNDESFCPPIHFHNRYVMKPAGTHLDRSVSLEEIISAIRDVVKVIKDLLQRRIVHGDICFYNVVLVPNMESPTSLRKGCVIDFVHAVDLDCDIERKVFVNPWFCPQYLAGAIYKGEWIRKRTYYQDLESTLYLLCFVCIALEGPDKPLDLDIFSKKAPFLKWDNAHSPESLYSAYLDRAEALKSRWRFKERILAHFHPYFEDLKTTALKMYDLLFPDVLYDFGRRNVEENLEKLRASLEEAESKPDSGEGAEKIRETLRQIKDCEKRLAVKPLYKESPDELFAKMFAILDGTLDRLRQKSSRHATEDSEINTVQSTSGQN
ncbi:hypothetical protein ACEPAG_9781 [Sanghuangporus baumii]